MLSKYIYTHLFSLLSLVSIAQTSLHDSNEAVLTSPKSAPLKPTNDTTHLLQEFIITGNYKPTGLDKCVIPTRNIVIEKLAALGVQNIGDVLKFQANMRIQQDPILGAGVSLQGISGENIKVLIDGVPIIGRQNGNIDLSQINLQNVERIEIVEGPLSVQYGTNALAGTINIITKKSPSQGIEMTANNYWESVGHFNVGGTLGWRKQNQNLMVSGGRNFFGGWSNGDSISRFQDWKPKIQYFADLHYGIRLGQMQLNYAYNYFDEFILNRGQPLAPYNETAFDDNYKTRRLSNSLNMNYLTSNNLIINTLISYSQYKRIKNTYYRDLVNLAQTLSENQGDQDTTRFALIAARGTIAQAYSKKWRYETGFDVNIETGAGLRLGNQEKQIGDYAAFASSEWVVTEGVTLKPGVRVSYNTSYTVPVIPSLHARWEITKNWTARASWGQGFRAPSLKELYFYFVDINHNIRGNENLKAESSDNFNIVANFKKCGTKCDKNIFKFEISSFYNNISNLITLAVLKASENSFTYININKFKTYGSQFLGEMTVGKAYFALGGGVTQRENKFNDKTYNATTLDARVIGTYKDIAKSGFDVNIWYKYTGRQPGFAQNDDGSVAPTYIAAYSLADAGISRRFWKNKINFSAGCHNLFNIRNIQSQLLGGAHSNASGSSALATGRNFYTKIEIKL